MNLSKIAAAITGVTLAATLAACGSSTKTADKTGGRRRVDRRLAGRRHDAHPRVGAVDP